MIFGIIGFGRFGHLWAQALSLLGLVKIYDKHLGDIGEVRDTTPDHLKITTLQEAAQADIVFILVPISEFAACCQEIKPLLRPDSVVVDCCSVKEYPVKIMQQTFPRIQPIIGTHPLFGPDSVKKNGGLRGHKIVVCPVQYCDSVQNQLESFFYKMGLNILVTTPEDHDKQMANSQALVHFIGRGLAGLNLHPQEIATPDFQALLNINNMVVNDTWQLFLDMQIYNVYAKEIRKRLIHELLTLEREINNVQS